MARGMTERQYSEWSNRQQEAAKATYIAIAEQEYLRQGLSARQQRTRRTLSIVSLTIKLTLIILTGLAIAATLLT